MQILTFYVTEDSIFDETAQPFHQKYFFVYSKTTWHIKISTFSLAFLVMRKLFAVVNIFNYVSAKVLQKCLLKIGFFKIIFDCLAFPYFLNLTSDIPDWFCKEIKSSLWSFPVFFFVGSFFDEELFSFTSFSLRLFCNDCLAMNDCNSKNRKTCLNKTGIYWNV